MSDEGDGNADGSNVDDGRSGDVVRRDRFSGGLGHALACEWDWDVALACGNACAVSYVDSGGTCGPDEIAAFIDERPPVDS